MNRFKFLSCLILLSILIVGCQIFPYVSDPAYETLTEEDFVTEAPQATPTPLPSTPAAETTPTLTVTPTIEQPTVEPTPQTAIQFTVQEGSPMLLPNFANPTAGCHWMGVAGQVFDEENLEILNLTLVAGMLSDESVEEFSAVTGTALAYGPGGYEIQLLDTPVETSQTYWIEIRDQDGTALSDRFFFDTHEDCERNLILINFVPGVSANDVKSGPTAQPTPTLEAYP
jgi:hypothetical protein